MDPNEKDGPVGFGPSRAVEPGEEMAYTIHFENMSTASAPAQTVLVTDPLSSDLDWSTVRFGEVAFGDTVQVLKEGPGGFSTRTLVNDYRPDVAKQWWVDIEAQLNPQTGKLYWSFKTIDPETNALAGDALAGFLPPNDSTGRGEGHVTFYIRPRADIPLGTRITNQASIIFDANPWISTNEVFNTIQKIRPVYLPFVRR